MIISILKNKAILSEISIVNEDLLNGGEILIGRESDCHICLSSFQISRYHAMLKFEEAVIKIVLLSEYGDLKVNGFDTKQNVLVDNDKIDIGEYSLVIKDLPTVESKNTELLEAVLENSEFEELPDNEVDLGSANLDEPDFNEFVVEASENYVENNHLDPSDGESLIKNKEDMNDDYDQENRFDSNEFNLDEPIDIDANNANSFVENGLDDAFNSEDDFDSGGDEFVSGDFGDEGFSSDDGQVSNIDEEKTQVFSSFASYSLRLFGEFAPFDRFNLEDGETFIGRDSEQCQIALEDSEVSKVHAIIRKTKVNCFLEDNDSANGIIHNGDRINKVELVNGDEFIIGDTTFTVDIRSDILEAEEGILMPVEENQEVEIEEIIQEEVGFDDFEGAGSIDAGSIEEKSLYKKIMNDPKKKRIAIIVAVFIFILLLLPEDKPAAPQEDSAVAKDVEKEKKATDRTDNFSAKTKEQLEQNYSLAQAKFNEGEYYLAKEYIDKVIGVDPNYSNSQTLSKLIQEGLDQLVKQKAKEVEEKERKERQIRILALVEKAKEAVKNKDSIVAKGYFNQIFELDPENIDVPPLKLEIEAYEQEQARIKQELDLKNAARQTKVDKLAPGKSLYLKGEWYKAIDRLENFLTEKKMDEDLITEATTMLKESKRNLLLITGPLLSKARSFKEGEDLKQSYETFGEILKYDPANEEALNERDKIFSTLENRSKKIYREALVAESLSLYNKAKEKFQEVQQISPINSEYFIKATDKLRNYLE